MGHIPWVEVGGLNPESDKLVRKMMLDNKTDFLMDADGNVYTRMNPGLVRVTNTAFLFRMLTCWKAGSDGFTVWEAKKEYRKDVGNLKPVIS